MITGIIYKRHRSDVQMDGTCPVNYPYEVTTNIGDGPEEKMVTKIEYDYENVGYAIISYSDGSRKIVFDVVELNYDV